MSHYSHTAFTVQRLSTCTPLKFHLEKNRTLEKKKQSEFPFDAHRHPIFQGARALILYFFILFLYLDADQRYDPRGIKFKNAHLVLLKN
jgi:hypothetical protein